MAYKSKVLTVPEGGLGVATHTPYVPLCGGTTSQAAVQDVAGIGTSLQALTSQGAAALPIMQTLPGGSALGYSFKVGATAGNPADSTTYYICTYNNAFTGITTLVNANSKIFIPVSGTITKVCGQFSCVAGSSENCTLSLRWQNTTDFTINSSLKLNTANVFVSNSTMSVPVSANDFFIIKFVCPAWVTNPTSVSVSLTILLT